jgi:AAR2 protein
MTKAKRNSILVLNCPKGTEIFLNFKFFKTAEAFKGFKFLSEDLHLLSLQTKQFATAFFVKLEPDTVYVLEYNDREEIFERILDRKKLDLLSSNIYDYDEYLAPVEYSDYGDFYKHVNLISDDLIEKLPKELSLMSSWSCYTEELDLMKRRDIDLVERMQNCKTDEEITESIDINVAKTENDSTTVNEKVVKFKADNLKSYNDPKDYIPFTKIDLKKSFMALDRKPTATEITLHSMDKSALLNKLSPTLLVKELQLSYLLITLQIWDAFEHFKNIIILFSSSTLWWNTCGDVGISFLIVFSDILLTGKEIWQEVGLDQPNFLESCLINLFGI